MNIKDAWLDHSTTGLRDTIEGWLSSPTGSRKNKIIAGTLAWVETTNPDAEDLREAMLGLRSGASFDLNEWDDALDQSRAIHRINPAYTTALIARDTRLAQASGPRSFGDSLVTVHHEFVQSPPLSAEGFALRVAKSNGCPGPRQFLAKLQQPDAGSPSLGYLPTLLPEIARDVPDFDGFPLPIQLHIWDNARANRLWLSIMTIIEQTGRSTLLYNILHAREHLLDKEPGDPDLTSIPRKVFGNRLVRFLALNDAYAIVKAIWKQFDADCGSSGINNFAIAEAGFDANISRLASIILQVDTLAQLKNTFVGA